MASSPSQRALDFMLCVLPEQRRYPRVHVSTQCLATFPDLGRNSQNAFLRDLNTLGAFFYCKEKPQFGTRVALEFPLIEGGEPVKAVWKGVVVRVEEFAPGAAVGVAVEFTGYEVVRPAKRRENLADNTKPFIAWTEDVVERTMNTAAMAQAS
jgi:PilZ domain